MPSLELRQTGDLNCRLITAESPECLVVLCHGFGAPGDDLVQIGAQLLQQTPEIIDRVAFAFPEAPLSPPEMEMFGGRAWWPIDMLELNRAVESGDFRDLRKQSPELLPIAREKLTTTIAELQSELGLSALQTIVGGFSQGSMLATDYTLHQTEQPAGLIVWSGTLLNESDWRARTESLQGLPILQSHGTSDQILPYEAALWLKQMFEEADADVTFIEFDDGHTIPMEAFMATQRLLASKLSP